MHLQEKLWEIINQDSVYDLQEFMKHHKTSVQLINQKSGEHVTHVLARNGQVALMRLLQKEYGVALDIANREGKVPLHEASLHGQLNVINFLIDEGVNIDPLKRSGWTPLMMACSKSDQNVVSKLVEAGANLHLQNKVFFKKAMFCAIFLLKEMKKVLIFFAKDMLCLESIFKN